MLIILIMVIWKLLAAAGWWYVFKIEHRRLNFWMRRANVEDNGRW